MDLQYIFSDSEKQDILIKSRYTIKEVKNIDTNNVCIIYLEEGEKEYDVKYNTIYIFNHSLWVVFDNHYKNCIRKLLVMY